MPRQGNRTKAMVTSEGKLRIREAILTGIDRLIMEETIIQLEKYEMNEIAAGEQF